MENQFAFPAQIFAAPPPPVMYGNFPPPPIAARISSPTFAMKNKQVTTDHRPVFRPIFPSADPLHPFKKYRVTVHFLTDGSKHVAVSISQSQVIIIQEHSV